MDQFGITGQQAPELRVAQWIDENGKERVPVSLDEYGDKAVVLFGFQSWCPGCHSSGFPTLQKLVAHYKDNSDVVFLAVQTVFEGFDANTYEKIREEQKKYDLAIPFGHDVGSEETGNRSSVMYDYHTGGTPWFIFLDKEHNVIFNDFRVDSAAIELLDKKL